MTTDETMRSIWSSMSSSSSYSSDEDADADDECRGRMPSTDSPQIGESGVEMAGASASGEVCAVRRAVRSPAAVGDDWSVYDPRMLETVGERRVVMGAGESSEKCRRWRNMMCGLEEAY